MTLTGCHKYLKHLSQNKYLLSQGDAFGLGVLRSGRWNMTLRDYSQTTRIKRSDGQVQVNVEVDHIGDMEIHVGNLLRGSGILGKESCE